MAALHPSVARGRQAVDTMARSLPPAAHLLAGCSGGADSLALVAVMSFVARRRGLTVTAIIVDHGLQPGSADIAQRAAAQCERVNVPAQIHRVEVQSRGAGVEASARNARYGVLEDIRAERDAQGIVLGHTQDDQAETVLLRLGRGSGARSLGAMAPVRGWLLRPFLGLTRQDTEAICVEYGLDYWTDPTNMPPEADQGWDKLPQRTRVRHQVMPELKAVLGPGVVSALARSADLLRDDADFLDAAARQVFHQCLVGDPMGEVSPGVVVLDVERLGSSHPALRRRVLKYAALGVGCPPGHTHAVHVLELDKLITSWRGQGPIWLPGARRAWRAYGRLFLQPPHSEE